MITRRSFLGTVAALAVSPVASKAAPEPPQVTGYVFSLGRRPLASPVPLYGETFDAPDFVWPRRDDGDTILKLR